MSQISSVHCYPDLSSGRSLSSVLFPFRVLLFLPFPLPFFAVLGFRNAQRQLASFFCRALHPFFYPDQQKFQLFESDRHPPWNYRIDLCGNKKKKERTCFSFLSISDGGISAWGMYRRNLRWRKESKGG